MRGLFYCGATCLVSLILMTTTVATAEPQPKRQLIQVPISPECITQFYGYKIAGNPNWEPEMFPECADWDPERAKPFLFRDPSTSVTLYVESDGRHVAAIDPAGALLWVRDPFTEAGLCPYRTARPIIQSIEKDDEHLPNLIKLSPKHHYVLVRFDSSQFGVLDETSSDFTLLGQN